MSAMVNHVSTQAKLWQNLIGTAFFDGFHSPQEQRFLINRLYSESRPQDLSSLKYLGCSVAAGHVRDLILATRDTFDSMSKRRHLPGGAYCIRDGTDGWAEAGKSAMEVSIYTLPILPKATAIFDCLGHFHHKTRPRGLLLE